MCDLVSVTFGYFLLHLDKKSLHFCDIGLHILYKGLSRTYNPALVLSLDSSTYAQVVP